MLQDPSQKTRVIPCRGGHTLIEVMIAIAVLTLAILGSLSSVTAARAAAQASEDMIKSGNHCERIIETYRALTYDTLLAQPASTTFAITDMGIPVGQTNVGSVEITPVTGAGLGASDLRQIRVTIKFNGSSARPPFRTSMTTLRSRY